MAHPEQDRTDRFVWGPGDVEIEDGPEFPVHPPPDSPHLQNQTPVMGQIAPPAHVPAALAKATAVFRAASRELNRAYARGVARGLSGPSLEQAVAPFRAKVARARDAFPADAHTVGQALGRGAADLVAERQPPPAAG